MFSKLIEGVFACMDYDEYFYLNPLIEKWHLKTKCHKPEVVENAINELICDATDDIKNNALKKKVNVLYGSFDITLYIISKLDISSDAKKKLTDFVISSRRCINDIKPNTEKNLTKIIDHIQCNIVTWLDMDYNNPYKCFIDFNYIQKLTGPDLEKSLQMLETDYNNISDSNPGYEIKHNKHNHKIIKILYKTLKAWLASNTNIRNRIEEYEDVFWTQTSLINSKFVTIQENKLNNMINQVKDQNIAVNAPVFYLAYIGTIFNDNLGCEEIFIKYGKTTQYKDLKLKQTNKYSEFYPFYIVECKDTGLTEKKFAKKINDLALSRKPLFLHPSKKIFVLIPEYHIDFIKLLVDLSIV